ncbi:MAG TPA: membrane dipeptidase [Flavobacterium sp.]|jgi:hypothetical protein
MGALQTSTPVIDLHIHSTMKPYGHSMYGNSDRMKFTDSACVWFYDFRSRRDAAFENVMGICRYRQSDFTSLTDGQVKIACVSLYPVEKEFFDIRKGILKPFEVVLAELASMFGKKRIAQVRDAGFSYFDDLNAEYEFLYCLNSKEVNSRSYRIIRTTGDISGAANLYVIPTIEGCHAFADGNDPREASAWANIENNVATVKAWAAPPLFVTFAHHFYNGLCTHAKSLYENSGKLLDQHYGMREAGKVYNDGLAPLSATGLKLIGLLLSTINGRRILIDVKHMSKEARTEYYNILNLQYPDVPVIWSHGAVAEDREEINMDLDTDVMMIYKTNGIIGIEMDQRILGYNRNRFWKSIKRIFRPRGKAYEDAGYFWNQIITIAEHAYKNGYQADPWKCIALGSDYDGIINPLNSYPDALSLNVLYNHLIAHLDEYWEASAPTIPKEYQGFDSADVIYRIMYKNALDFIGKHL